MGSLLMVPKSGKRTAAPVAPEKVAKGGWARPNLPGWSWDPPAPENTQPEKDSSLTVLLSQIWTKGCHPHQWWGMIR